MINVSHIPRSVKERMRKERWEVGPLEDPFKGVQS